MDISTLIKKETAEYKKFQRILKGCNRVLYNELLLFYKSRDFFYQFSLVGSSRFDGQFVLVR